MMFQLFCEFGPNIYTKNITVQSKNIFSLVFSFDKLLKCFVPSNHLD